ncbi:hypothetical protein V2A60_000840 [Cordyceps javanica]
MSNRGRKKGSVNKPDTVEKLLLRISESPVGEEVVQIIIKSAAAASQAKAPPDSRSSTVKSDEGLMNPAPTLTPATQCHLPPTECARYCTHAAEPQEHPVVVSPLDILAAAVAASSDGKSDTTPPQGTSPSSSKLSPPSFPLPAIQTRENVSTDVDLVTYLSTPCAPRNDWQILAEQPVESTFKLDASTYDPIASQIIDENDSQLFFKRFFANQNQVIGLLDPELHTPEYVYANSFTLFSVICALGCMGSMRPRDKIIYHGLLQLAEANVQWCIAACVPSLETIQAILLMCHWTPAIAENALSEEDATKASSTAIAVTSYLKNIAQDLPSSSAGSLYARLAQSLLGQEQPSGSRQTGSATLTAAILGLDSWSSDWWSTDIFTGNDISFVGAQDFSDCNFDNFDHMQIDESDNIMGTL